MAVEIDVTSPTDRHRLPSRSDPQGTRVGNGSALLPELDGRSTWARRAKELLASFLNGQLGGEGNYSEAEHVLVMRAVVLIIELERREAEFAKAGAAGDNALAIYQTTVNTLRRTLESIGLQRRAKVITPPTVEQYLQHRQREERV